MKSFAEAINDEIEEIERLSNAWKSAIYRRKKYDGKKLVRSQRKGRHDVYYKVERDKRIYVRNSEIQYVYAVQYYRQLQEGIRQADELLSRLNNFKLDYNSHELSPETINTAMPAAYQNLKIAEGMFNKRDDYEWWRKPLLELREEYSYQRPYPEQLQHTGPDGELYRSKSEVIIATYLKMRGYPYVYEAPVWIDGELVWTDFTVLNIRENKNVLIEHLGMMDQWKYCERNAVKMNEYLKSGWSPYDNLLFTYDHGDGDIDMKVIGVIIDKIMD